MATSAQLDGRRPSAGIRVWAVLGSPFAAVVGVAVALASTPRLTAYDPDPGLIGFTVLAAVVSAGFTAALAGSRQLSGRQIVSLAVASGAAAAAWIAVAWLGLLAFLFVVMSRGTMTN